MRISILIILDGWNNNENETKGKNCTRITRNQLKKNITPSSAVKGNINGNKIQV